MKKRYQLVVFTCTIASLLCVTGCRKKTSSMWDDDKTAANYKNKKSSLWGKESDALADNFQGPMDEDFIPLREEDLKSQFADGAIPQPDFSPGEEGSGIPGIDRFKNPSGELAAIFHNVLFNTDDHVIRGREHLATIDRMASYLKEHANTYIFIAGHADERGAEAYNLSLGARRANYIRTLLVQKGVDLNQIHTISYGKERPEDGRNIPEAWTKNRRAEFKIYQK